MREGVTIVDPDTTYLEPEIEIGRDTVIYPNTVVGAPVAPGNALRRRSELAGFRTRRLGDRVTVRESVIVDSTLGDGVHVGPFAHLRANALLSPACGSGISSRSRIPSSARAPRPTISRTSATPASVRAAISAPARLRATSTANARTARPSGGTSHRLQYVAGRSGRRGRRGADWRRIGGDPGRACGRTRRG